MMIALGAAKGLAFLHNAERPVIYRDFKTSNILLDSVRKDECLWDSFSINAVVNCEDILFLLRAIAY